MNTVDLSHWVERAPSLLPRAGCSVGVINRRIVLAGGTYWANAQKFWTNRVESFDPTSNTWSPEEPLPEARGDAAAAVLDNVLYVIGGGGASNTERTVLSFSNGTWKLETAMILLGPRRSSAALVVNDTLYLLGGLSGTGSQFETATSSMWAAKPGSTWRSCSILPGPPRFNAAVGVIDHRIVVAGGCTPEAGSVRNLDDIWIYEPMSDAWTKAGHLPHPLRGACGLSDGSRLLLFGGYTDKFESGIQAVDVPTGHVSSVGQLPCGLADARFVRVGPSIFGVTGENGIKRRFPDTIEATAQT